MPVLLVIGLVAVVLVIALLPLRPRRIPLGHVGLVHRSRGKRGVGDTGWVSVTGGPGWQAGTVPTFTVYWPRPFERLVVAPQVHVPNGTFGLVVARVGAIRPAGNQLAKHVECNHFQDAHRFLWSGGEQGRQQQVLMSGYYNINPQVFDVITVNTPDKAAVEDLTVDDLRGTNIPIGETGVVIAHAGLAPSTAPTDAGRVVPGHDRFRLSWVFLANGGEIGVQSETLPEGGWYVLNPWFASVVPIPTRHLILEWTSDPKSADNLDASLDEVVLDVQGHTVRLNMTQTVRIPAEIAPLLVRRFGHNKQSGRALVRQFVEKELAATVAGYFRRIGGHYRIQEFITRYDEVCVELAGEVRQALATTGIIAMTTTLEQFHCDEPAINEMRRRIAVKQEEVRLEEASLAELRARNTNEAVVSEIEHQRIRVQEHRERLKHVEIQVLVELLGPDHVGLTRAVAELVKANVPTMISGADGGMAEALAQIMPLAQAKDMLMAMIKDTAKPLPPAADAGSAAIQSD
ncbi:SPFH domain-containing protein [Actinokineospora inagensis]|uniref:SPFH domain-containing protein n=1 Tax=Actinokineospora inagensis TaxID=103730 RepID=UPI0003FDA628|nr:SPFH domain-containing protein [Actinokineospora inagensis]